SNPVSAIPQSVHQTLRSPGQPLDAATRAFMEPRFGQDFSHVRVHADAQAAESARAVNAQAYTVGKDIAFAHAQYTPSTAGGRELIAHELVHTIQQGDHGSATARSSNLEVARAADSSEREAEQLSRRAVESPGNFSRSEGISATRMGLQRKLAVNPAD